MEVFPKRKILVVSKQTKHGLEKSNELVNQLEKRNADIFMDPTSAKKLHKRPMQIKKFDGDIIITTGGDGTLLLTASQTNIPILPVRIGGYGFLCTIDFDDLIKNLGKLMEMDFYIEERLRLSCTRTGSGKIEKYMDKFWKKQYPHSLNEIVFTRKRPSKIMEVEFTIDSQKFSFVGDGLLLSTPSGSTGYHSSAGGSMADPSMQLISIAPLYPFFSKLKPLIIPADKKVHVKVKRGEVALIIDGHGGDYFAPEANFIIEKGEPSRIINLIDSSFYSKIKDRFLREERIL
jgi:NAD+ kinase